MKTEQAAKNIHPKYLIMLFVLESSLRNAALNDKSTSGNSTHKCHYIEGRKKKHC